MQPPVPHFSWDTSLSSVIPVIPFKSPGSEPRTFTCGRLYLSGRMGRTLTVTSYLSTSTPPRSQNQGCLTSHRRIPVSFSGWLLIRCRRGPVELEELDSYRWNLFFILFNRGPLSPNGLSLVTSLIVTFTSVSEYIEGTSLRWRVCVHTLRWPLRPYNTHKDVQEKPFLSLNVQCPSVFTIYSVSP